RPEQIALAGEGTGAVMIPDFRFVYDGIASMLGVLSMLAGRGGTLSQIVDSYPPYCILKGEVPLVTQRIPALLMNLRERFPGGPRQHQPRRARGGAGPVFPCAREPARAGGARHLRTARKPAGTVI